MKLPSGQAWLALALAFAGYAGLYWGIMMVRHTNAVPFLYALLKIGPSKYSELSACS